ncbi:hypothetical protein Acr_00g0055310 [Actinidia rufa]|uniref:Retrotransposon gag domain-containing protein n=1 Tax=Actinidia rufa TaxID=165716 RepID=A0A7J0DLV1_9ERIC|nr:hypothetical protein Acr_00g0055310 [Actinidia rufa]
MPPRNARGRAKSLTGARGARGACGAHRNLDEGDDHQESVMGGRASAPQMVRNTVQTMQVPIRATENRATTAMKAFLQLRPPTFKGEPDPLVAEDWLEQVTRALDTILVTEEELRVLFASYQLQGDALQRWKTVEEMVAKKWELFKAFLDQYFTDTAKEALRMEFINLVQGSMTVAQYEAKFTSLSSIIWPNISGRADLFWLSSTGSSCYGLPTQGSAAVVTVGGTISHLGTGTITSQGATYLLSVWSGWSYQSTVHAKGEQSGSYRITTTYSGQRTQGQVYTMTSAAGLSGTTGQQEQQLDTSVVRGTLLMFNSRARVLIDTGASHSFIASSFALALGLKVEVLDSVLMLDTPVGGRTTLKRVCRSCEIEIGDRRFVLDFIVLDMTSFDVIIGMDWLTDYRATIDCVRHQVTFCTPEGDRFHFMGDRGCGSVPLSIDVSRQRELNFFFSACLVDEGSIVSIALPPIVCEFSDVFPEGLTKLPPHREIKFSIDLIPGTAPISVRSYRFALAELQELKVQIQDLLDKGFYST